MTEKVDGNVYDSLENLWKCNLVIQQYKVKASGLNGICIFEVWLSCRELQHLGHKVNYPASKVLCTLNADPCIICLCLWSSTHIFTSLHLHTWQAWPSLSILDTIFLKNKKNKIIIYQQLCWNSNTYTHETTTYDQGS